MSWYQRIVGDQTGVSQALDADENIPGELKHLIGQHISRMEAKPDKPAASPLYLVITDGHGDENGLMARLEISRTSLNVATPQEDQPSGKRRRA